MRSRSPAGNSTPTSKPTDQLRNPRFTRLLVLAAILIPVAGVYVIEAFTASSPLLTPASIPLLTSSRAVSWRHDFLIEHLKGTNDVIPTFCAVRDDALQPEGFTYVDYVDGDYFLYDLRHPGMRIALFVEM